MIHNGLPTLLRDDVSAAWRTTILPNVNLSMELHATTHLPPMPTNQRRLHPSILPSTRVTILNELAHDYEAEDKFVSNNRATRIVSDGELGKIRALSR